MSSRGNGENAEAMGQRGRGMGPKYEKYDEISKKAIKSDDHGKKYTNKEELQEDMRQFYEDIFKYKPRAKGKNINTFLGELKK